VLVVQLTLAYFLWHVFRLGSVTKLSLMKKLLSTGIAFFLFCIAVIAQPRQGTVEYDKQQVPCYISDFSYPQSTAEDAIKNRFKSMGVKGNERKGFIEYNNVILSEIGPNPVDAKFKIEKRKGDKNASTVYMIVNPVGLSSTQAVAGTGNLQDFSVGSTNFLNSLNTTTGDYSLELEIKNQEEELKKAEKKQNNLVDDGNDMQKRLQRLQNDIEENRRKQTEQVAEVQRQRDILAQIQARRRTTAIPIKN
jgi:hypothetical protein